MPWLNDSWRVQRTDMTDIRTFVIGIAGGSGSGKSTLVEKILEIPRRPQVSLLPHDAYYLDEPKMPETVRKAKNWDHPEALDNELFAAHVRQLLKGEGVDCPVYNFGTHSRSDCTKRVEPSPVLLLEGILLFAIPEIRELMNLRVFVDSPAEERIVRRILRDIKPVEVGGRGRTVESVTKQFRETVRPMHDQYVEPSRAFADLIIPWDWGANHAPVIEVLLARIDQATGKHPGQGA